MEEQYQPIRDLLSRVRSRWRRLIFFHATVRATFAAAAALGFVLFLASWTSRAPMALAGLGVLALVLAVGALLWGYRGARDVPSDARVARFVEERTGSLDDRLVSAVDVATLRATDDRPGLAASMVADAARASSSVDPTDVVPRDTLRRAGFQAAAAALVLIAVCIGGWRTARQSFDALSLALFPSRIVLDVTPGNARVEAGNGLTIAAHLVGNNAPVVAQLLRAEAPGDDSWRAAEMKSDAAGRFTLALTALDRSFRYRVVAAGVTSSTFNVAVVRAPRVAKIDVEYSYPPALGLQPRIELDGGDIYAPAGSDARVKVHTDRAAATGRLTLANGQTVNLLGDGENTLTGSLRVADDGSYRVSLADAEGLTSRGDTEYFIRTLEDRPPDVHVLKPASDRRVTRLEEVDIEAEAQDDFGIDRLDLVYAVRGGAEKIIPLDIPRRATSATGRHTLSLEELNVQPGDFVSYYVRARDLPRGKRASESRSDIFFLEVKPFEEEFTLAQSQAGMGGGGGNRQLDDLVSAQKEIIVATWKLDRRAQSSNGGKSEQDVRSVATAEGELKTRVEETSSAFRESTMRDPRRRQPQGGRGAQPQPAPPPQPQPDVLRAGQTLPEEDAMTAAANAMGKAVTSLNGMKTADALPSEMTALNHLLKAQADVKKRQVQRQQAGSGAGGNRATQDMSSLFDKELARHQQTNYETPNSTEQREDPNASALDKIKDLARRQDELLNRQKDLARERDTMTAEELKRRLEQLTRDQNELRQRAEQLAQQMAQQQNQSGQQSNPQSGKQQGQQSSSGQQSQAGQQAGQQGQSGQSGQQQNQPGQQAQSGPQGQSGQSGQSGKQMRDVSEEMRNAASDLRRQDASQASERAARALDKLRDIERQLQSNTPDARRRALGDLELEARQLADGQRQIASEAGRAGQNDAGKDTLRRLAGEQDRLGDRLRRVQDGLKQQATGAAGDTRDKADSKNLQQAAADAAREMDRQRLAERMQQSGDAMRAAASRPGNKAPAAPDQSTAGASPEAQDQIARALDTLADKLSSAGDSRDEKSRKLSGQLARAQELRQRLDGLTRQLEQLGQQGNSPSGSQGGERAGREPNTSPSGQTGSRAGQPGGQLGQRAGQQGQQPGQSGPQGQQAGQPGGRPGQQSGQNGQQGAQGSQSPGQAAPDGKPGGQGGPGGSATEAAAQLREQANREIREVRELLNQLAREDTTNGQGGSGFTFESPDGMVLSAPGTEGFKNDFAKWQQLKGQATQVLERVESVLAKKLQENESKDRLAAGADDRAPAEYQTQVDNYFKALATKKK